MLGMELKRSSPLWWHGIEFSSPCIRLCFKAVVTIAQVSLQCGGSTTPGTAVCAPGELKRGELSSLRMYRHNACFRAQPAFAWLERERKMGLISCLKGRFNICLLFRKGRWLSGGDSSQGHFVLISLCSSHGKHPCPKASASCCLPQHQSGHRMLPPSHLLMVTQEMRKTRSNEQHHLCTDTTYLPFVWW